MARGLITESVKTARVGKMGSRQSQARMENGTRSMATAVPHFSSSSNFTIGTGVTVRFSSRKAQLTHYKVLSSPSNSATSPAAPGLRRRWGLCRYQSVGLAVSLGKLGVYASAFRAISSPASRGISLRISGRG